MPPGKIGISERIAGDLSGFRGFLDTGRAVVTP